LHRVAACCNLLQCIEEARATRCVRAHVHERKNRKCAHDHVFEQESVRARTRVRDRACMCFVLQCVAACCSVLQCIEVCFSVLQSRGERKQPHRLLWCIAVRCSLLQSVAVYCSLLQSVAVCCSMLQSVAVCCSLLQLRGDHEQPQSNLKCCSVL